MQTADPRVDQPGSSTATAGVGSASSWPLSRGRFRRSDLRRPVHYFQHEQLTATGLSVYTPALRGCPHFLIQINAHPRRSQLIFVSRDCTAVGVLYLCERFFRTRLSVSGETPRYEASIR
jgi:hypothetical protein